MDTLLRLWTQLHDVFSNFKFLLVGMIAVATFLFARSVVSIVSWVADPARRRLEALGKPDEHSGRAWAVTIAAAVQPFARYVMPTNNKERGTMQEKFRKAGIQSPNAMAIFYGAKTVLALVLLIVWMFVAHMLPRLTSRQVMLYGALAAFIGMTIPNFVLNRMLERRQRALRNAFPDALDLLVVCVEAGLGLAAGLQRVALELQVSYPELAGELDRVNAEMQAGMERELALRNLAARTGLEEIRGLVGLLVQTLRFGTSVADTLRVYAEEFRDRRVQRAEELAAKLGTKMIFPMVLCFFPSFFLVAVGPAIIRLVQVLGHTGGP
jgi:tight adherence protein C